MDENRIRTAAIIESGIIIGYYYNNNHSLDMRTGEEEHDINSRLQSIIRSSSGQLSNISSTSQDLIGKMRHVIFHSDSLDILVFPMPYTDSPPRILIVVSDSTADYRSLVDAIQDRLDQMKA
jgi:hypothetical protein